jgi:hypothetical protein
MSNTSKSLYFTRYFEPPELEKRYHPEEVPLQGSDIQIE